MIARRSIADSNGVPGTLIVTSPRFSHGAWVCSVILDHPRWTKKHSLSAGCQFALLEEAVIVARIETRRFIRKYGTPVLASIQSWGPPSK